MQPDLHYPSILYESLLLAITTKYYEHVPPACHPRWKY